jgi:hypothetical protein
MTVEYTTDDDEALLDFISDIEKCDYEEVLLDFISDIEKCEIKETSSKKQKTTPSLHKNNASSNNNVLTDDELLLLNNIIYNKQYYELSKNEKNLIDKFLGNEKNLIDKFLGNDKLYKNSETKPYIKEYTAYYSFVNVVYDYNPLIYTNFIDWYIHHYNKLGKSLNQFNMSNKLSGLILLINNYNKFVILSQEDDYFNFKLKYNLCPSIIKINIFNWIEKNISILIMYYFPNLEDLTNQDLTTYTAYDYISFNLNTTSKLYHILKFNVNYSLEQIYIIIIICTWLNG